MQFNADIISVLYGREERIALFIHETMKFNRKWLLHFTKKIFKETQKSTKIVLHFIFIFLSQLRNIEYAFASKNSL